MPQSKLSIVEREAGDVTILALKGEVELDDGDLAIRERIHDLIDRGRLHVVMDDGAEEEFGPGDIMMLPPGHDAWAVGDEPCVFIEFTAGTNYYTS